MKKLISNEVVRCQPASLRKKKLFHTSSFMYIAFIFLRMHHDYFFRRGFESVEHNFFQWKGVLLLIYLFNHDLSKSTIFMLSMAFDVLLSAVVV